MSAVVNEYSASADRANRVPSAGHVNVGHESVLIKHNVSEYTRANDVARPHDIVHIAKFRSHGEQNPALDGRTPNGVCRFKIDADRLLAQHRNSAFEAL